MTAISLRSAFGQAKGMLLQDRAALALYLAIGVLAPFLLHAGEPTLSLRALVAVGAGGGFFSGSLAGPLYLFAIMAILWTAAQFALWNALLTELRDGPIGEIMFGLVAGFTFLLCSIAVSLITSILPGLVFGLALAPVALSGPQGAIIASTVQSLIGLAIGAFIGSRLWLTGPIMAVAGSMNPIPAFAESWRRTAASRAKLFALFFALQLVFGLVAAAMLTGHFAIIFNDPQAQGQGETAMAFGWLVFWLIVYLVYSLLPAGLLRASSESGTAEVFA